MTNVPFDATPRPTFDAPAGVFAGWRDGPVLRASGIRYARAERFEPSVAEPDATDPVPATEWSPACPQNPGGLGDPQPAHAQRILGYDEDCLRLSVTAPGDLAPGEALPVMVWIHGGGYVAGAGDSWYYNATSLVTEQRVVVVHVSYRLGMFGFLGGKRRPANLGLLDLLHALRWVRRNSAAFGGDPGNVTVFGQSAGADAIAHLMISEGAAGLFGRAIIQSPPLGIDAGRRAMTAKMAALGENLPDDAPAEDYLRLQRRIEWGVAPRYGLTAAMPFGVQYGRAPMPAEADRDDAWRAVAPDVEILLGCNTREPAVFVEVAPGINRLWRMPLGRRLGYERLVRYAGRRVYYDAARQFIRRHVEAGGTAYRYSVDFGGPLMRGSHIIELALVFDAASWAGEPLLEGIDVDALDASGRVVREIWGTFARTGVAPSVDVPGLIAVAKG